MRRIVIILSLVALMGASFVSYWVYDRYIYRPISEPLVYSVEKGNLKEILHIRGDVAAEREYDLAFSSFGTVERVNVEEGQLVQTGQLLMRLETTDLELQLKQLLAEERRAQASYENANARVAQAMAARDATKAQLDEVQRGTRSEELRVATSKVEQAKKALEDADSAIVFITKDAYTKTDDAVYTIVDQLFQNPRTSDPQIGFLLSDSALHRNIELQRLGIEQMFASWRPLMKNVVVGNVEQALTATKLNIQTVTTFFDGVALALNGAIPSTSVSATTISTWQSNVSAARASINLAYSQLNDASAVLRAAQSAFEIALNQKRVLEAGSSFEQMSMQQAQVRQAEANIAAYASSVKQASADIQIVQAQVELMREKIRKASIYAPGIARVTKIWLKANEQYQQSLQGMPAISLATTGIKVQSDISEVDIPKIKEHDGNLVELFFDAYPEKQYTGKVISIEPKEIIKEGDAYYRVNFQIDGEASELRRGMSADIAVQVSEKKDILKIPTFAVYERAGVQYVTTRTQGVIRESKIRLGISDGDTVEVVEGLKQGDTVIVLTE